MPTADRTQAGRVHWSGSLVLFDVVHEGERVQCAISKGAIEDLAGTFCRRPEDAIAAFRALQPRIERIARLKFVDRQPGVGGRLHLWADDVDETADAGDPVSPATASHA